jgi:hypothetical protein
MWNDNLTYLYELIQPQKFKFINLTALRLLLKLLRFP